MVTGTVFEPQPVVKVIEYTPADFFDLTVKLAVPPALTDWLLGLT
jgi:hypothetical protein